MEDRFWKQRKTREIEIANTKRKPQAQEDKAKRKRRRVMQHQSLPQDWGEEEEEEPEEPGISLGGVEDVPLQRAVKTTLIPEYFQLVKRSKPVARGDPPPVTSEISRPGGTKNQKITEFFTGSKIEMREGS